MADDRVVTIGEVVENLATVAAAKEELARQMFIRLVLMGIKVGLFAADQQVTMEDAIPKVDEYLGLKHKEERTQ